MNRLRSVGARLGDLCETVLSASLASSNDIAAQLCQTDALTDGITVPFAVSAGMTATQKSSYVVSAGLAELFAAAISMGLGAYLVSVTENKHYEIAEVREKLEAAAKPRGFDERLYHLFNRYGVQREAAENVVRELQTDEKRSLQFLMDVEHRTERTSKSLACAEGFTMANSYFLGGLTPLCPYIIFLKDDTVDDVNKGLYISVAVTTLALLVFGYAKAKISGCRRSDSAWSAIQTLIVGVIAGGASYGVVRAVRAISPAY
ncbi:hypothetical protein D0863_06105 [Hortaea werneckii]|uniref:Uncharacterized protein n=1 Tax=Hortaea werneckii TaxID=91943 RepID=A0A3M7E0P0_HORWE|nr:hypothetical protein D0863_06105 [Hortaea werneckii]